MNRTRKFCLTSLFIAIGIILPFFTMQIKSIGKMLLPMHFPIFLCGLIIGPFYGLLAGIITPLLRSMIFGMPIMFPDAICMCIELGTYGFVSGFLYSKSKSIGSLYLSLISAMIAGRIMLAIAKIAIVGVTNNTFSFSVFLSQSILSGIPGIFLQLLLIPIIVKILEKH